MLKKAKRVLGEVRKRIGKIKSRFIKKTAPSRPNLVPGVRKIHKLAISGKLIKKQLEKQIAKTKKLGYSVKYFKMIGFKNAKTRKKGKSKSRVNEAGNYTKPVMRKEFLIKSKRAVKVVPLVSGLPVKPRC